MEACPECYGFEAKTCKVCNDHGEVIEQVDSCRRCDSGLFTDERAKPENSGRCNLCAVGKPTEAALRAQEVIDYRTNCKEVELYDKILKAGRFHAGFNIIGALSGRMSGSDDLNAQGIKNAPHVRECFTLGHSLGGGDFDAFEVGIMDAVYADEKLNEELKKGKKIHAIFGTFIYPDTVTICTEEFYNEIKDEHDEALNNGRQPKPALVEFIEEYNIGDKMEGYWAIMANKKKYKKAKAGLLGTLYGGDDNTLVNRLGVDSNVAKKCFHDFCDSYKTWGACRKEMSEAYAYVRLKDFKVQVPKEYAETMYGFRRYFDQEYGVISKLFEIAKNPPSHWASYDAGEVMRSSRKGPQTVDKAAVSALYGAVMSTQSSIFRAAVNHAIQGSGAQITKELQAKIWEMQPAGIEEWLVQPLQVHDEVLCVSQPELAEAVKVKVDAYVEEVKERVPLTGMKWQYDLASWQEKE
jgi:DNA polymerase I-like protein with 3'-5' exonuclease and polymerase domains